MANAPTDLDAVRSYLLVESEKPGRDFKAMSLAMGRNHAYMHQFIHRGSPRRLSEEDRRLLAEFLGIEEAQLKPGATPSDALPASNAIPALTAPLPPLRTAMSRDVPVLGTAYAGDGDKFVLSGELLQYAPRPDALVGRQGIYAVFLQGYSMVPWKRPGQIVYVDKDRAPYIGDHVLVQLRPTGPDGDPEHGALIKLLVKSNSEFVILAQYNPAKDNIKIARSRIASVHRIVEADELLGV